MRDADEYADEILPLDGPYTPEGMFAAAELIAELVRRMNHATLMRGGERALPYPAALDRVVGYLAGAAGGMMQLLPQLGNRLDAFVEDPRLGADELGPVRPPTEIASMAAHYLQNEAGPKAHELMDALNRAKRYTTRLRLDD